MSVLIKGMEMPKNCDECFFVGRGFPDWCSLPQIPKDEDEIDDTNNRPDWCPLEEVPETHDKRTETNACDLISRQAAIALIRQRLIETALNNLDNSDVYTDIADNRIEAWIDELPSAQPESLDEWCTDCKEYDHERHCCPRWNRVIRQTLDEVYAHAETEAEARFHDEIVLCKDCKHQVKEWRADKRLKDKGYMVCGCDVVGDACGYWALLGQDDDYCSMAERKDTE